MHWVVDAGHAKVCALLIRRGVSPNIPHNVRSTFYGFQIHTFSFIVYDAVYDFVCLVKLN